MSVDVFVLRDFRCLNKVVIFQGGMQYGKKTERCDQ